MLGWLIGIGYPVVAFAAARLAYGPVRDAMLADDGDGVDRSMAAFVAVILGAVWPLAAVVTVLVRAVMWHPRKTRAEVQAELEAEKAERHREGFELKRQIAALERELKIGQQ